MWEWLEEIFGKGFMPHGHCYLWTPALVWAQVGSNLVIGVAYASIATTLTLLVRRIRNIPFAWVYLAFGTFILSCGLTHWIDVVTVWHPIYWFDAGVRLLTAVASVGTAVLILPLTPHVVRLAETARLSAERGERLAVALAELKTANESLTSREASARQRADVSEEQFHNLVETMPQLAWLNAPSGTILYRNRRWSEYTGIELDALARDGIAELQDPDLTGDLVRRWQSALATETVFDSECRIRRADGELRWFVARAVPVRDKAGVVVRWVGTCTDIHDQRMLRDEALRTARMKDEFLATVSHELRTPLNAILGWSRMLTTGSLGDTARAKALETIERNAVNQVQLVDDLLDISRIVSGKMRLEIAPTEPAEAVERAIETVRPSILARELHVVATLDPRAGPVLGDAARLQQIVWNLLSNAIKFSPKGGRIEVGVARVDATVEITVVDGGIGIRPEFLPHVFDRFSQEDGSIRRQQGGLGLGLAIVKHLVELHGGTVTVASEGPTTGASFVVQLPVARVQTSLPRATDDTTATAAKLGAPRELDGLRLLVVEDDADSRELVCTILRACGVAVHEAGTAKEGLQVLADHEIDVILSDIGLGGVDGYEFMRSVRANPAYASIPSAALTAYARAEDRREALEAGYQMHLPKPIEPAELLAVVANLVGIRAAMKA